MERHARRAQPGRVGVEQQRRGRGGRAPELAVQREAGARAAAGDPDEHLGTRRAPGDLRQLGGRVDGEPAHAAAVRERDVPFLLDGAAVGDVRGPSTGRQAQFQLRPTGDVESRAETDQECDEPWVRIRLDRIEQVHAGERVTEFGIPFSDGVHVQHQARSAEIGGIGGVWPAIGHRTHLFPRNGELTTETAFSCAVDLIVNTVDRVREVLWITRKTGTHVA